MIEHVEAIKDLIPYTTYFVDVPTNPTYPYVLVWTSAGSPGTEPAVCGPGEDIDAVVGLTHVAGTPEGALIVAHATRAVMKPTVGPLRLDVPGHAAWLTFFDSQNVQVDRDVTIPSTNRHPAFVVDLYRLTSTPA